LNTPKNKFIVGFLIFIACWILLVFFPSVPKIRVFLAKPLIVSNENANGDAAYVLAGGNAFGERLSAAADLYHMGRISQIIINDDSTVSAYNFQTKSNWTISQWAIDFLRWLDVPRENIKILPRQDQGWLGTLSEAEHISRELPGEVKQLVIVTSAAHTRRAMLAFRRTLPPQIKLVPYAATSFLTSAEMWRPLWIEYSKIVIYWIVV